MLFDDLKTGQTALLDSVTLYQNDMTDFALKFDNIPLHTDEEYAKTTPFKRRISPGVFSFMSVWSKYLEKDFFGTDLLAGKSTKIEWFAPVYAGDTLSGKAVITKLTPRNEKNGLVEVTIDAYNQHGELVLKDVTEAVVKRKI
jgi:acyl dehydratase